MTPEDRISTLGLTLPAPTKLPPGLSLPFSFVNVRSGRAVISGHPRQGHDGSITGPYGRLGADMTTQDGYTAAGEIALTVLANLKAEIGELRRVTGWVRVFGMVASTQDFTEQHLVINGFSDLILEVFGPDIGAHARSALGVASLPMGFAMEIEGEALIAT
ncbi:MAG: RidA family protein [Pseudomonadota bacterium]